MKTLLKQTFFMVFATIAIYSCAPKLSIKEANRSMPNQFTVQGGSYNSGEIKWGSYFNDQHLIALIDTALKNNQELNIILQNIEMERNEVRARKGEYLPFVDVGGGAGFDKVGRYTRSGALEATTEIEPGKEFPEPLGDYKVGAFASWEVDVWKKLRTAKKSAYTRYLSSVEARNFMVTNLVAEIANAYYELLALDNQLELVRQNIQIQSNALEIVKLQKQSARVTELAVKRFEAQLLDTRHLQFGIRQDIIETENKINFLVGRFPQPIQRDAERFNTFVPDTVKAGIPSQLLENRPDIRRAELEVMAANLDIQVAKANFYPRLGITAGVGYQAFSTSHLLSTPESMLYYLGADLMGPVVNRNGIKAMYFNANAAQIQSVFEYEQTLLNAYIEVVNQLSAIENLRSSYTLKAQQVEALNESITISNNLFRSARADYMEVLLTQEEALESRFELIETKMMQMHAWVAIYRVLGGGWN